MDGFALFRIVFGVELLRFRCTRALQTCPLCPIYWY